MKGKEFGEKYIELLEDERNYETCIDHLERLNDQWRTDKSVEVIKEAQNKVENKIKEMNNYNMVK